MADWNLPTLTTLYADVLTELKGRDETALKMDGSGTNLPVDAKKLNVATGQFEQYDGTTWAPITSYAKTDASNTFTVFPQRIMSDVNDSGYFDGTRQDGTRQYLLGAIGSTIPLDLRAYDVDGTTILGRIYFTSSGNIALTPKSGSQTYVYSSMYLYPESDNAIDIYSQAGKGGYIRGRATDGASNGWYIGRGAPSTDEVYLGNYVSGAGINLSTNGGPVKANGNEIWHAGNDDAIQKAEDELTGTVDFNTITKPGNYRVNTSGNTYSNTPETTFQGVLVVNGASPSSSYDISTQMLFSYTSNKVYHRTMWGTGIWSQWVEQIHSDEWFIFTLTSDFASGNSDPFSELRIKRNSDGMVTIEGVVQCVNTTSSATTIATLPTEFRPAWDIIFNSYTTPDYSLNGSSKPILIDSLTGNLTIDSPTSGDYIFINHTYYKK